MKSARLLSICLLFIPLALALPHTYAQTTSITGLTYDSSMPAGSLNPLSVRATVSFQDVPLNSTLVVAVLDESRVPAVIVQGVANSHPDPCYNQPVAVATCDLNPTSRSGQEQLEFKIGGILADQPQINLGAWNLNMTAAVFDSKNNLIKKSLSTAHMSVTITGLALTVIVPLQVSASVDGAQQPPGTARIETIVGDHNITVPSLVNLGNATRLRFDHWDDGTTEPNLTVKLISDTAIQASYVTQYYLTLASRQSTSTGEAWYDSGSTAAFAVPPTEAMGGVLGLLGGKMQFQGWYEDGKLITSSIAGTVSMDQPHKLTAQWQVDYTLPLAIVAGIMILVTLAYVAARRALRPERSLRQEARTPTQRTGKRKTRKRVTSSRNKHTRQSK